MATAQQANSRWLDYMPLSKIDRAERNPKQHDEVGIRGSLGRWGVADLPVLDERTGRLVSGHGRLDQVEYLSQLDPAGVDAELVRLAGVDPAELDDLLALLDTEPIVHDTVPATGARYAESVEQEAKREERIAGYQPAIDRAGGFSEVILVYPTADREEVGRLIVAIREVLGADLRAADVVLRALRVLTAVLDSRNDPAPVSLASLARHAGWAGE